MLSQPSPPMVQSVARQWVISSSQMISGSLPSPTLRLTKFATCNKEEDQKVRNPKISPRSESLTDLLVAQHVPDAVTGQEDPLPGLVDRLDDDVGVAAHDLVLGGEVVLGLEAKVPERAREREVSVDAVELDEAAGLLDARALLLVAGLVVDGERLGHAADGGDGARVAHVARVNRVAPVKKSYMVHLIECSERLTSSSSMTVFVLATHFDPGMDLLSHALTPNLAISPTCTSN